MEKTYSKGQIYSSIFALGWAGGSIFIIPYIKFVFYDLQLQVTGMSNTQSALLLTLYSMAIFVVSIPGGFIVDRMDSKKAIQVGLIGTSLLTVLYVFVYKSYVLSLVIWALLCLATMGIYWPGFSKILNVIGAKTDTEGTGKSGMTFGLYYACNGISAAIINAVALWASSQFENPDMAFKAAVLTAAASTILGAIIVQFLMNKNLVALDETLVAKNDGEKIEKTGVKDLGTILKNPMVWMLFAVTLVGYSLYTLQGYFTPYLTAVVGVSTETSGIFAIIRTYVFLVLAPVGGFFADKVFKSTSKWLGIAFGIMAVVVIGFLVMPSSANVMFLSFYTLLPSAFVQMTYTIKYSAINEVNIPLTQVATVTSLASIAGSLADIAFSPLIAFLLDTQGDNAYTVLFVMLTVLLVLGAIASFVIVKNKKNVAA